MLEVTVPGESYEAAQRHGVEEGVTYKRPPVQVQHLQTTHNHIVGGIAWNITKICHFWIRAAE